jgi:hypothetical protein
MKCTECARLMSERTLLKELYDLSIENLNAAAPNITLDQYTALKKLADETKADLDRADLELARHRATEPSSELAS